MNNYICYFSPINNTSIKKGIWGWIAGYFFHLPFLRENMHVLKKEFTLENFLLKTTYKTKTCSFTISN